MRARVSEGQERGRRPEGAKPKGKRKGGATPKTRVAASWGKSRRIRGVGNGVGVYRVKLVLESTENGESRSGQTVAAVEMREPVRNLGEIEIRAAVGWQIEPTWKWPKNPRGRRVV